MSSSLLGPLSSCGAPRVPRCALSPSRCGEGAKACGFWSLQAWLQSTTCHGSVTKRSQVSKRPSEGKANPMTPEIPPQHRPPSESHDDLTGWGGGSEEGHPAIPAYPDLVSATFTKRTPVNTPS